MGRGLDALLGDKNKISNLEETLQKGQAVSPTEIGTIQINQIEMVNHFQPRQDFDEQALEELADSIKVHGIIQPLTVRRLEPGKYQLIAGERRFRAAKKAGLTEVPVFLRAANDEQMLEMALIENIQREDLNPIEIALSYNRMIQELNMTHKDMADRIGKGRTTITNYLRLLKLPEDIIKSLRNAEISMGHAKALMGTESKDLQIRAFREIMEKGLSVRQIEKLVREMNDPAKSKAAVKAKRQSPQEIHLKKVSSQLQEKLGNQVSIKQTAPNSKGQIVIHFGDDDQLNDILEILDII